MADAAHDIDPVSHALGNIEGRLDGIEKRMDRFEGLVVRLFAGLYILLSAGFSIVGWLITNAHTGR
jgi:hypothetical protein